MRDRKCPEKRSEMKKTGKRIAAVLVCMLSLMMMGIFASASDDNSLASLGINTEGVTVTPEFAYDTWEYTVTVPAGTTELNLSPVPSSSAAVIADVSGTTLNPDGTGTVYITVQAGNGDRFTYTLNVTGGGPAPEPTPAPAPETQAPQTEAPAPQTEAPETEPQTEDNKYVRVERNTIQEAENTISNLKADISKYRDTLSIYTKIMYGLIAIAVVLFFIVINLILKKKDLKSELNEYRSLGYSNGKHAQKPSKPQAVPAAAYPQEERQAQTYPQRGHQENPHYTNGGQLDVRPQTSQKKSRKLPEYQGEGAPASAAGQVEAKQAKKQAEDNHAAKEPKISRKQMKEAAKAAKAEEERAMALEREAAQKAQAGAGNGKSADVQVDMIDL